MTREALRWIGLLALAVLGGACSSPQAAKTPEQERYLSDVEATPLEFSVPRENLDLSIDRAIDWLVEYDEMKFTENDRRAFKEALHGTGAGLIAAPMKYHVSDLGSHGYGVAFALEEASVSVRVMHQTSGGFGLDDVVARNAHILAHYIETGEVMPELVER